MYTNTRSSTGVGVDVCLFGSLENTADYVGGSDQPPAGWSSSAARTIARYIQSRGAINNSQWDDPESLAFSRRYLSSVPSMRGLSGAGRPSGRGSMRQKALRAGSDCRTRGRGSSAV